jgi:hypothetical protein
LASPSSQVIAIARDLLFFFFLENLSLQLFAFVVCSYSHSWFDWVGWLLLVDQVAAVELVDYGQQSSVATTALSQQHIKSIRIYSNAATAAAAAAALRRQARR